MAIIPQEGRHLKCQGMSSKRDDMKFFWLVQPSPKHNTEMKSLESWVCFNWIIEISCFWRLWTMKTSKHNWEEWNILWQLILQLLEFQNAEVIPSMEDHYVEVPKNILAGILVLFAGMYVQCGTIRSQVMSLNARPTFRHFWKSLHTINSWSVKIQVYQKLIEELQLSCHSSYLYVEVPGAATSGNHIVILQVFGSFLRDSLYQRKFISSLVFLILASEANKISHLSACVMF